MSISATECTNFSDYFFKLSKGHFAYSQMGKSQIKYYPLRPTMSFYLSRVSNSLSKTISSLLKSEIEVSFHGVLKFRHLPHKNCWIS